MTYTCIWNGWPPYDMKKDRWYGKLLHLRKLFRKEINMEDIERIKTIEAKIFPPEIAGYGKIQNKEQFLKKMVCSDALQIEYQADDDFLFLAVHHYNNIKIQDFGMTTRDSKRVFKFIKEKIKEYGKLKKPVYMEARESTAYKIMKYYEHKGYFKINEDKEVFIGKEKFHRLKLVANK